MRLADGSRRLTGPNVQTHEPGVVAEVEWEPGDDPARAIGLWREEVGRMLAGLDFPPIDMCVRSYARGAALVFTAPVDLLLAATDVNDWAVASAAARLAGGTPLPLEPRRTELAALLEVQRCPGLVTLRAEARKRGVPWLLDDAAVTLGHARRSRSWPFDAPPRPEEVPWSELGRIPVALVTGTNGKTTSARLVAHIARRAGYVAGNTSTDGISVGGALVEKGDWTGPAAALRVLRHPDVEVAILETARGGILRRGLAVDSCEAALITNVAADHLGDYGVDDVAMMARVKAVVGSVAQTVVLNAEDPELMRLAPGFPGRVVLFSLEAANPAVDAHRAAGGEAWLLRDDALVRARGAAEDVLIRSPAIPITFGGLARFNVANALGAAALATALGFPDAAIVEGLSTFGAAAGDNPGRGNLHDVGGVRVLIDFGHNPAGIRGIAGLARALTGPGRLFVSTGMPGDRPDEELSEVAAEIAAVQPDRVVVRELPGYLRGREPGAVPTLLRAGLEAAGVSSQVIESAENEVDSLRHCLELARPGDMILVLAHLETEGIRALLAR